MKVGDRVTYKTGKLTGVIKSFPPYYPNYVWVRFDGFLDDSIVQKKSVTLLVPIFKKHRLTSIFA